MAWLTSVALTISPTVSGPPARASSDTIWILVGSASARNQAAYLLASARGSVFFIVCQR